MAVSEYLDPTFQRWEAMQMDCWLRMITAPPSRSTKVDSGPFRQQQVEEGPGGSLKTRVSPTQWVSSVGGGSGRYGLTRTVELRHLSLLEADTLNHRCVLLSLGHAISDIDLSLRAVDT